MAGTSPAMTEEQLATATNTMPQSTNGSCTRMVSSRFGLVESSATGAPISSSSRRTYLMHCAGSSAQDRAPRVDCDPAFHRLVDRLDAGLRPLRRRQMIERQPVEPVADADLELGQLVEHVELGERDAVDAGDLARLAHQAGVEPAAAARPPGHRAELDAALAEQPAGLVLELGRERPLAHPRGVGLGDAEHVVDRARAHAGAGRGLRRHGVRRGDERIGAVVDVEQRPLRAFEQDALALAALARRATPTPCRRKGRTFGAISVSWSHRSSAEISGSPSPRRSGLWWARMRSIFGLSAGRSCRSITLMARRPTLSS